MVMELRPAVDWHKGAAVMHLLRALRVLEQPEVAVIAVGDDITGES
jgi:trehalose 6-phosphate phosphatase